MPDVFVPMPTTTTMLNDSTIDSIMRLIIDSFWAFYSAADAITVMYFMGFRFSLFWLLVGFAVFAIFLSFVYDLIDDP